MLTSDEAQLTQHYGDKNSHGIYISCRNIKKDLRGKASKRNWMKIGEIPIIHFIEKSHQVLLAHRLAHKCLDIATELLKKCSHSPIYTPNPSGCIRLLCTILVAHVRDTVEQQKLACVAPNSSPVSIANYHQLGLGKACRPRTAKFTLGRIRQLVASLGDDRDDLWIVKARSATLHLNGVLEPYWRDWKYADPSIFLSPDALHQWHGFFMDHPMKWAQTLLTAEELDKRISVLQKHIGFRTFPIGFSRFIQHTGREERDLQRSFMAVIAGHPKISENILRAFRSLLDYIYIAQYDSQSTETLKLLRKHLRQFHRNKVYLSRAGICDGSRMKGKYKIPKLELLHNPPRQIPYIGSAPQFSADYMERLHIDNAKIPYKQTN